MKRWVSASHSVGHVVQAPLGGYLTIHIQAAGRLDSRLRVLDDTYGSVRERWPEQIDLILTDYLDQSRLWVLDAYELMRTLDACIRGGLWTPSTDVAREVKGVKQRLAEVRVPLAKFEPSGRSGRAAPGDLIARPVLGDGIGAAWNVGGATPRFVSRRELSDAVLTLLETVRSEALQQSGDPP
jgi:hypothetical protein